VIGSVGVVDTSLLFGSDSSSAQSPWPSPSLSQSPSLFLASCARPLTNSQKIHLASASCIGDVPEEENLILIASAALLSGHDVLATISPQPELITQEPTSSIVTFSPRSGV
jgi:hypothetical protein